MDRNRGRRGGYLPATPCEKKASQHQLSGGQTSLPRTCRPQPSCPVAQNLSKDKGSATNKGLNKHVDGSFDKKSQKVSFTDHKFMIALGTTKTEDTLGQESRQPPEAMPRKQLTLLTPHTATPQHLLHLVPPPPATSPTLQGALGQRCRYTQSTNPLPRQLWGPQHTPFGSQDSTSPSYPPSTAACSSPPCR